MTLGKTVHFDNACVRVRGGEISNNVAPSTMTSTKTRTTLTSNPFSSVGFFVFVFFRKVGISDMHHSPIERSRLGFDGKFLNCLSSRGARQVG